MYNLYMHVGDKKVWRKKTEYFCSGRHVFFCVKLKSNMWRWRGLVLSDLVWVIRDPKEMCGCGCGCGCLCFDMVCNQMGTGKRRKRSDGMRWNETKEWMNHAFVVKCDWAWVPWCWSNFVHTQTDKSNYFSYCQLSCLALLQGVELLLEPIYIYHPFFFLNDNTFIIKPSDIHVLQCI